MTIRLKRLQLACVAAALLTVAGCGGGGGGSSTASPSPATTSVPVTVIDGAIQNATVCLDKSNNGACDSGEPSGKTDASGNVTLQVDPADAGQYPVLAVVGTDAVDADTGAVPVPFTLKAPADKPAVVSPLTTLVQQIVESSGGSTTEAENTVKSQTGLNVSLFEDFTKNSSSDGKTAATVARMVVVTTQQQSQSLTAAVGATDSSGSVITKADVEKAIRDALLQLLPQIIAAAADSTVQSACASGLGSDACKSAVSTQASSVASQTGLSTTTVATVVGVSKQIASASSSPSITTPAAGGSLRWFAVSDDNQWAVRMFVSSAAEATPDANGLTKFRDIRSRNVGGVTATWAFGSDPTRAGDLHWNGSSWVGCPFGFQSTSTVRDAQGVATSNYCDNHSISTTKRAAVDIAGQKMADVINQIKAYPYLDGGPYGQSYANWGPQDTAAGISATFGTTTFPDGARIFYQTGTDLSTAYAYDVQSSNIINQVSAAVAAGGDARSGSPACGAITPSTPIGSYTTPASTLEGLISTYQGTPCSFNQGSIVGSNGSGGTTSLPSLNPNEWWGQSTLSIGTVGSAATGSAPLPTAYYTTNTLIRLAFTGSGTNAVTYYACKQRWTDGSPRNCTAIGTGSYSIAGLGDARVLTLTGVPSQASPISYNRLFVERGGKVYLGYQSKPVVSNQIRLNLTATNALFGFATSLGVQGLSQIVP